MTLRDWRAGELRFLLVALIVAVSALCGVGFFVERMRSGLERDAHQLMGADMLVNSDGPVPLEWREEALRRHLLLADSVNFPSMLQAGEGEQSASQLIMAKAMSELFPLRGRMKVTTSREDALNGIGQAVSYEPRRGTVWLDPSLLGALKIHVGDQVKLGDKTFRVAQLIAQEPDRGPTMASLAPHVLFSLHDLPETGLVATGARVSYRMQVAAQDINDMRPVAAYAEWLRDRVKADNVRGVRIETLDDARPDMQNTIDRAQRFLSLVGLMSALLAAVAVAMAARRFMLRHLDACAMLRCLGMTQNQVALMYLVEFLLVGLAGSVLGVLVGLGAHYVLAASLAPLINTELPPLSWVPAAHGLATGMVLLLGFALPPVLQLRNVPHNRVIRREQAAPQPMVLATYGVGALAFGALLLWQAGDLQLACIIAGGFLGGFGLFALVGWGGLVLLRRLRGASSSQSWRFAITSLQRRPGATVVQVVSLALGLMALLVLTVVRGDLLAAWRQATPPDAPNHFIINISPDQRDGVARQLARAQVPEATLYPMIRGRLVAVNGKPITAQTYAEGRARGLAEREFNLSTMKDMPATNRIVAGQWYVDQPGRAEASVEQGIAKTLGWKLGDKLRFDMAGQVVEATITSLRKLEWGSMRANFFVIINPAAMAEAPTTYMTAYHQPPRATELTNELTRDYPNLTIIDVSAIIRQLQDVLDQVVQAVEFLFAFTLASGLLVLYAALMSSTDERRREAGLLRALGATRRQLSRAQWIEFALVGGLAGLLAATGAAALGWALATYQFKFEWSFSPVVWGVGLVVGAACAVFGGWLGLRNVLNQPPLQTLREA
ncbi:FtsX-like permease family protein [Massilia arenosa]|uniref:FtsX-like permease family protein n=1 Tax=Zemynaea arenosa TaxID=2561931 RepID=A0A4Y9S120_9BURK|nr:FtsX-like permease family protein [Massilia arenosa]TFW13248.1 FtsX-like permease family protein [Massilia arenosa]